MFGEGFPGRTLALEGPNGRGLGCDLRRQLILASVRLQLLELQFHLFEKPRLALGTAAVKFSANLLDLQLQSRDECLGM